MNYSACTSILVGRKATMDGSVIIGRNEDAKAAWPKHFVVHPAQSATTPQQFVSTDNGFTMPLPQTAAKYTATPEWTDKYGLFEEDGINEYGVAMSATESTYSNERVLGADPLVKDGLGEEAMVTVVLPYVKTAREGVLRLGQLVETYGTSESNGILFADQQEAWYLETGAGHYWVAQRIPDNGYAVVANQMAIQAVDFNDADNFLFAHDLQAFVAENHLNPHSDRFIWRDIFGTQDQSDLYYNTPRVWYGQRRFTPQVVQQPQSFDLPFIQYADHLLSVDDAQGYLSSHFEDTPYDPVGAGSDADRKRFRPVSLAKTQESHVLQLRPDMDPSLAGIQWLAMGVAAQSVYVPFYAGIDETPTAYHLGAETYDSQSAYWVYKLVSVLLDAHYHDAWPTVSAVQKDLRIAFKQSVKETDAVGQHLSGIELNHYLTQQAAANAALGIRRYRELAATLITQATDLGPLNYHQDLNL
ncbi:C69 family dipeptidase [Levilactobacillus suantsaiihabitans]|uniref:Dipeptidase n=1 Tax=Levilactobacillus suantsaiihabitans TaxID=2487722 RepID=A0A4Z0J5W4_9LACO|nr:C69 family dipeptidase [Levilactobacillus suantsaiihabitans]TGD17912.1 C69 family dipeptidase [Levilactobacillus suantsaiihabitans]